MNIKLAPLAPLAALTALVLLPQVALAGTDIDGDGYDDLLVAAPRIDAGADAHSGGAGIYLGSSTGLGADDFWYAPPQANQQAGFAVAVGDFNCDGTIDRALGAPNASDVAPGAGAVYLYLSDAQGDFDEQLVLVSDLGFTAEQDDGFGRALAAADFDDDGCDDLAIGRPRGDTSPNHTRVGSVHMLHGELGGPLPWAHKNLRPEGGEASDNMRYGFSLSTGDLSGDGIPDLIIGAPSHTEDGVRVGKVFVRRLDIDNGPFYDPDNYWGNVTPCSGQGCAGAEDMWFGWSTSVGDYDGDNILDLAVGAPGTTDTTIVGSVYGYSNDGTGLSLESIRDVGQAGDRYGFAMASGDVDGDGTDDIAVGAPLYTPLDGPNESGMVRIMCDGLVFGEPGSYRINLNPRDFDSSPADKQRFGASVSFGYFNGGQLDLAVGAKRAKDQNLRSGGVYVYENLSGSMSADQTLLVSDFGVAPNQGAHFGGALSQ